MTLEESEVVVLHRRRRKILFAWCEECGGKARMSIPEDAGNITGLATRKIYQKIESGQVHFIESATGELLVCVESLTKESL